MKNRIQFLLIVVLTVITLNAAAQQDAHDLIKQGIELNNARNYAGAIEKYKVALALEPDNASANYQLAFSLSASGKGSEAVPYLQKVVKSNASPAVLSSTYGLMGGIYDQAGQVQKAIDSYQSGIRIDSGSYALHYGLGLAYFRNHQYAEAEQNAVAAIQIDPKQAGSMRLYALVTFHQDKRAAALLGFCQYLWLEPKGPQSVEAYGNLQHILQGGVLKPEPGVMKPHFIEAGNYALNQAITQSVTVVAKRKYIAAADPLSEQLEAVFTAIGQLAEKQQSGSTFFKQLAKQYYQLAQTPNVPAFARFIRQSADKTAAIWLTAHAQPVTALEEWMKAAPALYQ